ncbi:MAG: GIY-YIG nuclease family protein [Candidatus Kerfeldbacteria bacterium]|jgi:putative endonuclease
MYTVYILKSQKDGMRYIGVTLKDANIRIEEHNSNKSKFTRGHQPWKLIYTEVYKNKKESYIRESFLKSGQGRKWLDKKLK